MKHFSFQSRMLLLSIYAVCSAPGELSSTWFVVLIVARLGVAGSGCPRCGAVGTTDDVGP